MSDADENIDSMTALFECMRRPLDSVNLRRFFLMLVRAHWMDGDNHGKLKDQLGCMVYSDADKDRTLEVLLSHDHDTARGEKIPAIFVGTDGTRLRKLAIGDDVGKLPDNSGREEGKQCATVLRIAHRARGSDQALLMAESTATLLQGIHKDIMTNIPLTSFSVDQWTDAAAREQGETRYFQVDLTCSMSFNFLVQIDIESHRIKKFGSTLSASVG